MDSPLSRRQLLGHAAAIGASLCAAGAVGQEPKADPARQEPRPPGPEARPPGRVKYCLNMSTVREQKLSVPEQVDLAARLAELE